MQRALLQSPREHGSDTPQVLLERPTDVLISVDRLRGLRSPTSAATSSWSTSSGSGEAATEVLDSVVRLSAGATTSEDGRPLGPSSLGDGAGGGSLGEGVGNGSLGDGKAAGAGAGAGAGAEAAEAAASAAAAGEAAAPAVCATSGAVAAVAGGAAVAVDASDVTDVLGTIPAASITSSVTPSTATVTDTAFTCASGGARRPSASALVPSRIAAWRPSGARTLVEVISSTSVRVTGKVLAALSSARLSSAVPSVFLPFLSRSCGRGRRAQGGAWHPSGACAVSATRSARGGLPRRQRP